MASKCFCDACGAEMPATGSRCIEVHFDKCGVRHTFRVDTRKGDFDVCERCICKAFAAKLDGPKPAPMHIPYAEQERIGAAEQQKVVRREPTERMVDAGTYATGSARCAKAAWEAMYDAA